MTQEEHKVTKMLGAGLVLKLGSSNFWSSAVSLTLIMTENKGETEAKMTLRALV